MKCVPYGISEAFFYIGTADIRVFCFAGRCRPVIVRDCIPNLLSFFGFKDKKFHFVEIW